MGYRSTFVSEDRFIKWPQWFVDKWESCVHFSEDNFGVISSKCEMKAYQDWNDLEKDIQKVLNEKKNPLLENFGLVYLHEDLAITSVVIEKDNIFYFIALNAEKVEDPIGSYYSLHRPVS